MMLHGKNTTLKESQQLDVYIKAFEQGYIPAQIKTEPTKSQGVRSYFASMSSTFLSLF